MGNVIERLAESNFMKKLQQISQKMTTNEIFATISSGMGATMGLIMLGAVIQIICALGELIFKWSPQSPSYIAFYMPYKLTMGLLGFFMCFSMAANYAKRKKKEYNAGRFYGDCLLYFSNVSGGVCQRRWRREFFRSAELERFRNRWYVCGIDYWAVFRCNFRICNPA